MSLVPVIRPSRSEILADFARIVGQSLRIDPARVTPDARLDDLGAESIDLVEIAMDVENTFSIVMPERTVLDVADDVLGEGATVKDGVLTDLGSRLLAARMPEVEAPAIAAGTRVADVHRLFLRVDVWCRLIEGIVERSPRVCDRCGGALVQGAPACVRCPACDHELPLPAGDDLNRAWVRGIASDLGEPADRPAP
jgi:acyl carrier protein